VLISLQEGRGTDPLNQPKAYALRERRRHETVEVSQQFGCAAVARNDGSVDLQAPPLMKSRTRTSASAARARTSHDEGE
jgi:hypothetical protein